MKKTAKKLYTVGAIVAGVFGAIYLALAIILFIFANNEEVQTMVAEFVPYLNPIEDLDLLVAGVYLSNTGFSFLIMSIASFVAIGIFVKAREQLNNLLYPPKALFIVSIIFGCYTGCHFGTAAGILSLIYRANELKNKNNNKVVSEQ